ncbi:MAG: DUF2953 domain-containing protein [Clostridiales bacterium]
MIVLKIFTIIILFCLFLIIILITLPIKYSIILNKFNNLSMNTNISLFLGLLKLNISKNSNTNFKTRITLFGFKFTLKKDITKTKTLKENRKRNTKNMNFTSFLNYNFINSILKNTKKIIQHILPNKLVLKAKIGFEDPYLTGILNAYYYILMDLFKDYNISLNTVFDDEIIEIKLFVKGKIYLIMIFYLIVKIIINIPNKIYTLKSIFIRHNQKFHRTTFL